MKASPTTTAVLLLGLAAGPVAGQTAVDARADLSAQVRAAETAFAATLAARDLGAFGGFVSEEAVFVGA